MLNYSVESVAYAMFPFLIIAGTVFACIGSVWFLVSFFRMGKRERKEENKDLSEVTCSETADDTVVAAITAAVYAYLSDEASREGKEYKGFKIVSFKRSDKGRPWTDK